MTIRRQKRSFLRRNSNMKRPLKRSTVKAFVVDEFVGFWLNENPVPLTGLDLKNMGALKSFSLALLPGDELKFQTKSNGVSSIFANILYIDQNGNKQTFITGVGDWECDGVGTPKKYNRISEDHRS